MSGFDFVFALFSLVLGLAFAEVLGGFALVMKLHARARAGKARDVRVGWLVPLLAVLVTLNQLSMWMMAFAVRDNLPLTYVSLLLTLLIVGAYYLFSVLVFPDDPADWPDFDLWYDKNNRFILIGLLVINVAMQIVTARYRNAPTAAQEAMFADDSASMLWLVGGAWLHIVLLLMLIVVKRRWLNTVLLVAINSLTVAMAIAFAALGGAG
jgi:hypothetical protein